MADKLYRKSETANDVQHVGGLDDLAASPSRGESARPLQRLFATSLTPAQKYIGIVAASFVAIFVAAWIWADSGKTWFLDTEYMTWLAKMDMVESCDLGETAIIGDSQPMAGMMPSLIDKGAVNLAMGGASPIEVYYLVRRILKCPKPPRRLLVSFSPGTLIWAEFYWSRAAFFRYFSLEEMEEVRSASERLDDTQLYPNKPFRSLRGYIKNLSYDIAAPFHYSAAMRNAWLFARKHNNDKEYTATLHAAGHRLVGTASSAPWRGPASYFESFSPGRLQDDYFNKLLSLLADRKIDVYYAAMPESELTSSKMRPEIATQLSDYLDGLSRRHSNFHILIKPFTILPSTFFGDSEHLNEEGGKYWSSMVAKRLAEAEAREGQPR